MPSAIARRRIWAAVGALKSWRTTTCGRAPASTHRPATLKAAGVVS